MPYTAVIILQYGGADLTRQCIDSLLEVNSAPVKFIVVDNASPETDAPDKIHDYIRERFPHSYLDTDTSFRLTNDVTLPAATLVRSATNRGYARGNNIGIRLAFDDPEIDSILISNPDIIYTRNIIPKLKVDAFLQHDSALVGPVLYRPGETAPHPSTGRHPVNLADLTRINFRLLRPPRDVIERTYIDIPVNAGMLPIELISGGCFFVLKEVFQKIGGFDPGTWLYYEENILWERISQLGLRNYIDTSTSAIHLIGETINRRPRFPIVKAGLESQRHLVKTYFRPRFFRRLLYDLSVSWSYSILYLRNLLRK
ncbi:MAG: glycosyltransferase family 2 protein [Muribaculaceae bacterium]|nr:glycosyltransferase family 2 protein [Muribaculaceae bacterium]MDE6831259.1 glycosyltransferase family 2 protein [Muribaculaceae bacterium]